MIKDIEVEFEVLVRGERKEIGRTRHRCDGVDLSRPHKLQIARISGEEGRYLLYLDNCDSEMTDTLHRDAIAAREHANWEFGVLPDEWVKK